MTVISKAQGAVTTIAINRPEVRNAVDPETARLLFRAFLAFEQDDTAQVAVLTGAGGVFCAGFDLKAAGSGAADGWTKEVDIPADWTDAMAQPIIGPMGPTRLMLTKPVIAAIEGPAVAGGLELAAWCDMRIVARDATFGVFCRRWGVPLIDGGTVRLPQIVGQGRANDLILTGRAVDADEAYAMGLANRICEPGCALSEAQALASDLTRYPQACLRADHLSARSCPKDMAVALRREWQSASAFAAEGRAGAARFAAGKGRSGAFDDI